MLNYNKYTYFYSDAIPRYCALEC